MDEDPDAVFLADTECCGQTAETFGQRPGFDAMRSVEGDDVVALDDDIASRRGPRIVEFLEIVERQPALVTATGRGGGGRLPSPVATPWLVAGLGAVVVAVVVGLRSVRSAEPERCPRRAVRRSSVSTVGPVGARQHDRHRAPAPAGGARAARRRCSRPRAPPTRGRSATPSPTRTCSARVPARALVTLVIVSTSARRTATISCPSPRSSARSGAVSVTYLIGRGAGARRGDADPGGRRDHQLPHRDPDLLQQQNTDNIREVYYVDPRSAHGRRMDRGGARAAVLRRGHGRAADPPTGARRTRRR